MTPAPKFSVGQRVAIYRHNIIGIFDTEKAATDCAIENESKEKDNYHTFDVGTITLNKEQKDIEPLLSVQFGKINNDFS